jgi:hypothetical protein
MATGGWWLRQEGRYIPCPGGETMSRRCLLDTQTQQYQAVYILQYTAMAYVLIAAALDVVQIPAWVMQVRRLVGSSLIMDCTICCTIQTFENKTKP